MPNRMHDMIIRIGLQESETYQTDSGEQQTHRRIHYEVSPRREHLLGSVTPNPPSYHNDTNPDHYRNQEYQKSLLVQFGAERYQYRAEHVQYGDHFIIQSSHGH